MKHLLAAVFCLLCLGHTNGQTLKLFSAGNEYVYSYHAQALSGLPDNSAQQSCVAIKGTIVVQASQRGSLMVKIRDLSMATVNQVLTDEDVEEIPYRWEAIKNHEAALKSPIKVNLKGGSVDSFEAASDEPATVTNVKKAILTAFQLQVLAVPLPGSGQSSSPYGSDGSDSAYGPSAYSAAAAGKVATLQSKLNLNRDAVVESGANFVTYDVMEDDVAGKCVSNYLVGSQPSAGNPNAIVLNVTKIDDYEDCEEDEPRQWILSSMPAYNCSQCDADEQDMVNTVKLTTYDLHVNDGAVIIDRIESQALTVYTPLSALSDEMHTKHSQRFVLRKVQQIQTPIPTPVNPKRHEELKYEFPGADGSEPTDQDLAKRPIQFLPLEGKEFPDEVRRLAKEITLDILNNNQKPNDGTPLKAADLARAWSTLPKATISYLFEELATPGQGPSSTVAAQTLRHVTIDTMIMCGTEPALSFAMSKILSEQIRPEEVNQVLMAITSQTVRPTVPLIRQLQKTCELDYVTRDQQRKNTCWLTFAGLVDQACGDVESALPVTPDLDTFCNDDQAREFIKVLDDKLRSARSKEDRILIVHALSQIDRDEVVEVLRPIANEQRPVEEYVRLLALNTIAHNDADEVSEILDPVFYNKNESSMARIAAFQGTFRQSDDPLIFDKMAAYIQTEDDDQVVYYVHSTIEKHRNNTHPCKTNKAARTTHAQSFLDEDIIYGIQDSQVLLFEDYDNQTDTATAFRAGYAASNNSIFPRLFSAQLTRTVSGNEHRTVSMNLNFEGVQSVIDRIIGPQATFFNLNLDDAVKSSYEHEQPRHDNAQFNKPNIVERVDEPLTVGIRIRVQNTATRYFQFDADSFKHALKSALSSGSSYNQGMKEVKLNYQKLTSIGNVKYQIPSCLGLPIVIVFKAPAILDVRGKVSTHIVNGTSGSLLPKDIIVRADLKPTVSLNILTTMGVFEPFKKRITSAGVCSKFYLSLPFQASAIMDTHEAKLAMKVKPMPGMAGSAKIFSYKVKPFTSVYSYDKFEPIGKNAKLITVQDEPDQCITKFGEHLLGIPMKLNVTSDMFWLNECAILKQQLDENPLSQAMLWWATPDFKHREYQLTVDAHAASQAEITTVIDLNYLPSRFQQALRSGQNDFKGTLAFILGWTNGPAQCELMSHSDSTLPNYPQSQSDRNGHKNEKEDSEDQQEGQSSGHEQESGQSSSSSKKSPSTPASVSKLRLSAQDTENALQLKFMLAITGPVSRSLKSVATLSRNRMQMTEKIDVHVEIKNPPGNDDKLQICASSLLTFPKLPCDIANSLNPDNIKPMQGDLKISFGQTCGASPDSSETGHINVHAAYAQSKEKIADDKQGNEWYLRQCVQDYKSGRRISEACMTAVEAVANLNKNTYTISYKNLPDWLVNATHKLDDYVKYVWYDQMSNNAVNVHNPEGRIVVMVETNDPAVDVHVFKPTENTFFEKIYAADFPASLKVLNIRETAFQLYLNDLLGGDAPPTCRLMNHDIESYENQTYRVPITQCQQILTKDCSPSNLFTVLVKRSGWGAFNSRELEVQVLDHSITAKSKGRAHGGAFVVSIDGGQQFQPQENEPVIIKSKARDSYNKTIAFVVVVGEFLHIRAPHHLLWLTFDGLNVNTELSNIWRGKVCGMCGEMDGNSADPFVGPEQCSYASSVEFALSYMVTGPQCKVPVPYSNRRICPAGSNQDRYKSKSGRSSWSGSEPQQIGSNWEPKWSVEKAQRSWPDKVQERSWPDKGTGRSWAAAAPVEEDDDDDDNVDKQARSWAWSAHSGGGQKGRSSGGQGGGYGNNNNDDNDDDNDNDDDDNNEDETSQQPRSWPKTSSSDAAWSSSSDGAWSSSSDAAWSSTGRNLKKQHNVNEDDDDNDDDDQTGSSYGRSQRQQNNNDDDDDDDDNNDDDQRSPSGRALNKKISDDNDDDDDDDDDDNDGHRHPRRWSPRPVV